MRRWIIVLAVVAMVAGGFAVWTAGGFGQQRAAELVEIEAAPFVRRVEASGEIRSSNAASVGCPSIPDVWDFTIVHLAPEGQEIQAGQPAVVFDGKALQEQLQTEQSELDTSRKELERTRLEQQEAIEKMTLELAEARAKEGRLARKLEVPAELQQRLELEKVRLDHELAREEVRLIDLRIEAQRAAMAASIETAEGKVRRLERKVALHGDNLARLSVMAPRGGYVAHVPDWNKMKPKVGETVWAGRMILDIADLTQMEVAAEVAEPYAGWVEPGQAVEIRLDASPDRLFTGRVTRLGRLFHTKSAEVPSVVFDAVVSIDEPDPEMMRPGMAAQVVIVAPMGEPVIQVPESAVRQTAGGPAVAVRRPDGTIESVPVTLGQRWEGRIVVTGGLAAGDRVLAEAPDA